MPRKTKPKKRPLCPELTDAGRACRWQVQEGKTTCKNHDPERAEERRAAGGIRHPMRFHPADDERIEAVEPTLERLADRLIDIGDRVQRGKLAPELARAATMAIRGAVQALAARRSRPVAVEAHDAEKAPPRPAEEPSLDDELQ